MLLVIDVGNSHTVIGLFEGERLAHRWRLATDIRKTTDEYFLLLRSLISGAGLELEVIEGVGICSVVPPLSHAFLGVVRNLVGVNSVLIGPGVKTGMPVLYENPAEVGSDRIANAVAAYDETHGPVIIVDFGTATTFCAVSGAGEYLGGSIVPGIEISADALSARAAKLPRVEIKKPASVVGRTAISSIQSGVFFGHLCIVEGMLKRIMDDMDFETRPRIFATGGFSVLLGNETDLIDVVDPYLTLKGIRLIYEKNR